MKYPNFKFSLKSFLIVVTVLTVFIGWRLEQRRRILGAINAINDLDGTTYRQWQQPKRNLGPVTITNGDYTVQVPYEKELPDGSKVTAYRTESNGRIIPFTIMVDGFSLKKVLLPPPSFSLGNFLSGSHSEISATAVELPVASIDDQTILLLVQSGNLETVILQMDENYFRLQFSSALSDTEKQKRLRSATEQLELAKKLLKEHLPNASIYDRGYRKP